jgi:hypothetical protein
MTKDRLENELLKNRERMTEERGWHITGPLCVVLVLALVTADFHDLVLGKSYWFAIFAIGALAAGIHCALSWSKWRKSQPLSIEQLVDHCLKPPE